MQIAAPSPADRRAEQRQSQSDSESFAAPNRNPIARVSQRHIVSDTLGHIPFASTQFPSTIDIVQRAANINRLPLFFIALIAAVCAFGCTA
ncbi:MAG TPA: hypothetical protein VH022_06690, partial [Candidatus Acidoferrum sp.]|nr:hypothetical protein [Candidatus Acidoferrum sp.]